MARYAMEQSGGCWPQPRWSYRWLLTLGISLTLVGTGLQQAMAQTPILKPAPPPPASKTDTPKAAAALRLLPNPDLLSLPATPAAVEIDLSQPLTLQQAFALARRNNRDLQIVEQQLRQNRASLDEARAALYPTVTLGSDITRSESAFTRIANAQRETQQEQALESIQGIGLNPFQEAIVSPLVAQQFEADVDSNVFSTTLQVNYDVFTSGQRSASIRAAEAGVRFAELDVARQTADLFLDVADSYYNIQQADALVRIGQAAVQNAQLSLRDAEALERAGLGTRFDVLRAQVQLANAQQQLTQALSQQRIARRQLAQILSVDQNATLSAADPVEIAGRWTPTLEESIVLALQSRVELPQLMTQREVALQNRRVALASLGPQVSVAAGFNTADELSDAEAPSYGYSVGGRLGWTLFDGGSARAIAAQQEANAAIAETQFANFKNLIRYQVEQNFFNLQSNFENIQTNSAAVEQAQEGLRLARLRFQAGVGTQLEVSNAERDLTRAQSNLLASVVDYNRSLVALQRFVNNIPERSFVASP